MKFFITFLLFVLSFTSIWGQKIDFDSLTAIWENPTIDDSLRLTALHKIIRKKEIKNDLEKALFLSREQLNFSLKISSLYWEARSSNNIGLVYSKMHDYENALPYYIKSVEINNEIGNYKALSFVYRNIAKLYRIELNDSQKSIEYYLKKAAIERDHLDSLNLDVTFSEIGSDYRRLGDFPKALEYYLEALDISEERGNEDNIVNGYAKIGNLFMNMKDLIRAEEWYLKALEGAVELGEERNIAHAYNNLGNIYLDKKKYALALEFFEKSLEIKKKLNDKEGMGNTYGNLGIIYLEQQDYTKALSFFEKSFEVRTEIELDRDIILSHISFGDYFTAVHQYTDAIEWCEKGLVLAQREKELDREIACYECLSTAYEKSRNYKKSLEYYQAYSNLSDSIYTVTNARRVTQVQSYFEYEKEKNAILETNEKNEENYKNKLSDKSKIQYGLLTLVALLGLLIYFIYKNSIDRKNTNKELVLKNNQIVSDKKIIEKQSQEIRERDELKTRFFTHISHELRTPLTLILGPIRQMIKSKELSSKDLTYAKLIEGNAKGLLEKTNEILSLTKLDHGILDLRNETVNLYSFIKSRVGSFQTNANMEEIILSLDFKINKKIKVILDKGKYEQILNNYLSNALKYTTKRGNVSVVVEEKEGRIILLVKDTGQGIHPKDIGQVFDRFYQAKHTKVFAGTGIGLALCRELANVLKGKVWVESVLGEGTEFYFEMPLIESFENVSEEIAETNITRAFVNKETFKIGNKNNLKKILLVEDNQDLCTYISMILTDYDITIANNGLEALELIEKNTAIKFDLIISDLMMPKMDGFALLEHLKSKKRTKLIPIIILSARADWDSKSNALQLGIDDYILKPFKEPELKLRIINLLENKNVRELALQNKEVNTEEEKVVILDEGTKKWLRKVEELIQKNKGDSQYKTQNLAADLDYSNRQLRRRLQELLGMSPSKYIRAVKLEHARQLLEKGEKLSVAEVAYAAGFETPQYFSKIYVSEYGKKPKEYLR